MKNKYRNELKIINHITATERYKMVFICSIILVIYGGISAWKIDNFFDSIMIPFRFSVFNIFMFSLLFINNMNICSTFKNDFSFYIMRLENKKEYIRELLKLTTFMYLFHMLIVLLFIFMIFLLTNFNNLDIYAYQNYTISNLTYCCFYLIRYIIYGLTIMLISSLIYINTNDKITIGIEAIFLFLFHGLSSFNSMDIKRVSLSLWSFFMTKIYESFTYEIVSSLLMLIILEIIIMILYRVAIKNKRVIIT